jgi:ornithine decarboxylase
MLDVIAEPGRLLACSVFTLVCQVVGMRGDGDSSRLYLNDGVYGNFMNAIAEQQQFQPCYAVRQTAVKFQSGLGVHEYSLWGPTCDSLDCLAAQANFDEPVKVGDWLVFDNMGAYTSVCQTKFNGFDTTTDVLYVD